MKKKQSQKLSLVVPCYNEEVRFQESIPKIIDFLSKFKEKELILVDDGSKDKTKVLFGKISKLHKFVKVVSYSKNQGKGYALRQGILAAKYPLILISDIDLSTPLDDFFKLENFSHEFDIVIGSRAMSSSNITKLQNPFKVLLGKSGNLAIRVLLGLNLKDTQCGFKLFHKNIQPIFKKSKINGFGYDFEALFLAKKSCLSIKEVGVNWKNDERSKVKLKHYFKTLGELLKINYYWLMNRYN